MFLVEFANHEDADYLSIHEDNDRVTTCSRPEDLYLIESRPVRDTKTQSTLKT